jgi:hypothetical protein
VQISFEVLSDTIPFDDQTTFNKDDYSIVTFAVGDHGTFKDKSLGNEIKYYVRKDKKITLLAPDLEAED